jgi:aldose 1-epimerase
MTIDVEKFGDLGGERIDQFRLRSDTGVEVDIMTYGVTVRDWRVPVAGKPRSVVLGFEKFPPYLSDSPYFGALAGRVANRTAGASFEIDGKSHSIDANEGKNSLHGGSQGLGRALWKGEADTAKNAVRFSYRSPDGEMGYPGNVDFTATYSLKGNALRLELSAIPDRVTPINVVQHQYFNLGTDPDVLDHTFQINANAYTELDAELIPTGVIRPVAGTQYDFRTAHNLRNNAGNPASYDINLVLDTNRRFEDPIATAIAPDASLTLKLFSDQPGLQFYNAVYTDVQMLGLDRKHYGRFSGFCLEDQAFPDAVHHPHFPSIWYSPDRHYGHWCEFEIS